MRERLANIYRLGIKELFSLRYDAVLVFLIVYAFTYAIYAPARQASTEVRTPLWPLSTKTARRCPGASAMPCSTPLPATRSPDRPGDRCRHGYRALYLRH